LELAFPDSKGDLPPSPQAVLLKLDSALVMNHCGTYFTPQQLTGKLKERQTQSAVLSFLALMALNLKRQKLKIIKN
jgi:hypothetical protein